MIAWLTVSTVWPLGFRKVMVSVALAVRSARSCQETFWLPPAGTVATFCVAFCGFSKRIESLGVKLISTVAKPRTLVEGTTDDAGQVSLSCPLPVLDEGTAALIVQASSGKESAEIKQMIKKPARKAAG